MQHHEKHAAEEMIDTIERLRKQCDTAILAENTRQDRPRGQRLATLFRAAESDLQSAQEKIKQALQGDSDV